MNRLGSPPHLCLITPGKLTDKNYQTESASLVLSIREAVSDGIDLVQLREKGLSAKDLLDLTRRVLDALSGTRALVFVNDRGDVAVAAGAAGVHLPASSLPAKVVRENFPGLLIGVSTHSLAAAKAAAVGGADFILFGPVFDTPGKGPAAGLPALEEVCRNLGEFPVIGLGGIDDTNFQLVLDAGAGGVAAIRALNDGDSRRSICDGIENRAVS